jgi:hypothetical protein
MELLVIRTVTLSTSASAVSSLVQMEQEKRVVCTHQDTYMSGAGTMCSDCGTVLIANALKLEQTYQQNQHYFSQYRRVVTRSKPLKTGTIVQKGSRDDTFLRILVDSLGPDGQPPQYISCAARTMFQTLVGDEQLHRFLRSDAVSITSGNRGKALLLIILIRVMRSTSDPQEKEEMPWLTEAGVVRVFALPKKFITRACQIVGLWQQGVHRHQKEDGKKKT